MEMQTNNFALIIAIIFMLVSVITVILAFFNLLSVHHSVNNELKSIYFDIDSFTKEDKKNDNIEPFEDDLIN